MSVSRNLPASNQPWYVGDFRFTYCPWKIAEVRGKRTKVLAMRGPISQYRYGTPWDYYEDLLEQHPDWQPGWVVSPESGLIVVDRDYPERWPADSPIPLDGPCVSTGRDGGRHNLFDGRQLGPGAWPEPRSYEWGECKSNGFVVAPPSFHPGGRRYEIVQWPGRYQAGMWSDGMTFGYDGTVASASGLELWEPHMTRHLRGIWEAGRPVRAVRAPRTPGARAAGGGTGHDCYLAAAVWNWISAGLPRDQVLARWLEEVAGLDTDPSWPFIEADFERHYRGAAAKLETVMAGTWDQREVIQLAPAIANTQVTDFVQYRRKKNSHSLDKLSDQGKLITSERELASKLTDERNDDELSVDWQFAPAGTREFYEGILAPQWWRALQDGTWQRGVEYQPSRLDLARWKWLCTGNQWPLIRAEAGRFFMLADRPEPGRDKYPGCPRNVNPKAGERLGEELQVLIVMLTQDEGGRELTAFEIALFGNRAETRKVMGWKNRRYISVEAVRKARQRAPVKMTRVARCYRDRHRWACARPARWEPEPGWEFIPPRALIALLDKFLLADEKYLRRRLEAA